MASRIKPVEHSQSFRPLLDRRRDFFREWLPPEDSNTNSPSPDMPRPNISMEDMILLSEESSSAPVRRLRALRQQIRFAQNPYERPAGAAGLYEEPEQYVFDFMIIAPIQARDLLNRKI